jgi:hypothetical protein
VAAVAHEIMRHLDLSQPAAGGAQA